MAKQGIISVIGLVFALCLLNLANCIKRCGSYGDYDYCDEETEMCIHGKCEKAVSDCGYYNCPESKSVCCDQVVSRGCCSTGSKCCGRYCCSSYDKCCGGRCISFYQSCSYTPQPKTTTKNWWNARTTTKSPPWYRKSTTTWRPTRRPPTESESNGNSYLERIYIPIIVVTVIIIICVWVCACMRRRKSSNRPVVRGAQTGMVYMIATNRQNGTDVSGSSLAGPAYNNDAYTAELYATYGDDAYKYMAPPPYPGPPMTNDQPPAYTTLAYRGASAPQYATMAQENANVTSTGDVNGAASEMTPDVTSNQSGGREEDSSEQENIYHEIR